MKFSLNIEYSEKEYLAAMKTTGSMLEQLLGLLGSVRERAVAEHAAGSSFAPFSEEVPGSGTVLPFPVEVPRAVKLPEEPAAPPQEEVEKYQKRLRRGEKAFSEFIHAWLQGLDIETMELREEAVQPDRDMLLRTYANGPTAYPILLFVQSCGGLQQAVARVTNSERLGLDLTRFIVPPASIAFPDLADQYEYGNPFRKDDE